jgi:hypothetical protein
VNQETTTAAVHATTTPNSRYRRISRSVTWPLAPPRWGPRNNEPPVLFARIAVALAGVAHALLGLFILASLLSVHGAIVLAGLVAWGVGVYLISRWRRNPGRVILIPIVLAGAFFGAILIGERFDLVGP